MLAFLKALYNFTDFYNIKRQAGEEWLITREIANSHIVDVYEKKTEVQKMIVLGADEFCVPAGRGRHRRRA